MAVCLLICIAVYAAEYKYAEFEANMLVTVASFKGGVAKTTTAVHIAAYLHMQAPTLLARR